MSKDFLEMVVPCAVTESLTNNVMKHLDVTEKQALWLLGFDLKKPISTYKHRMRNPKRPYETHEAVAHHGVVRTRVRYNKLPSGNVQVDTDHKGNVIYTNRLHSLVDTYLHHEVVQELTLPESTELVNILDVAKEYVG